ncbi:MAG: hypothetical protein GY734_01300 [Herbaspirillum sp.]|nr:hypothetical protein [Herbaspirillum sp.]
MKKPEFIPNFKAFSIQILVAIDLGMKNVSFKDEAEKCLNDIMITPIKMGLFSKQAKKCVTWINKMQLKKQAFKLSENYF